MQPILFQLRQNPAQFSQGQQTLGKPRLLRGGVQRGPLYNKISGVTKDSSGIIIGGCIVKLFRSSDDVKIDETVSDASGNYSFTLVVYAENFYLIAYKAGAPDLAGTTVNTVRAA